MFDVFRCTSVQGQFSATIPAELSPNKNCAESAQKDLLCEVLNRNELEKG